MCTRLFLALVPVFVAAGVVHASDTWERVGPLAGRVNYVTIHPSNPQVIYFAAADSPTPLRRTLDGGATSSTVPVSAWRVLFNPTNPDILYAYWSGGVQKSSDAGTSWSQLSIPGGAGSLAIDASNTDRLFAGNYLPVGVYATSNGGTTWSPLASFGAWSRVSALAVDPANGNTVYAGTAGDFDFPGEGLFKTTDGGLSWSHVSLGHSNVEYLAIDPSNAAVIYAGTSGGGQYEGDGVMKSADSGSTWTQAGFPGQTVRALVLDPAQPSRVYAVVNFELYVSNDSGSQWALVDTTPGRGTIRDISLFPGDPDVICLASSVGVLVSTNAGGDFVQWGFEPADMTAVLVDRTDGNVVYATGRGRFKSTDGAEHWQPMGLTPFGEAIIQDPVDTGVLYNGAYTEGGVEKSTDSGATWLVSLAGKSINDVALAPSNHSVVYAGGLDRAFVGAIYKSVNAGSSWTALPNLSNFFTDAIAVNPLNDSIVFAGGHTGLIKSVDGGVSWSPIQNGLDEPASGYVLEVLIDPMDPETVYCGTYNEGVFKSVDGGAHWTRLTNFMTDVRAIEIDPEDTQIVYAAWYSGVYISVNGGISWHLLGNAGGGDLALDPNDRNVLYAAGGGVWRYVRTSQSAVPVIEAHQPEVVVLSDCESGCELSFSVGTPDDYSNAAVVTLERKSGDAWVQEDDIAAPLPAPAWQLSRTFYQTDAAGDYIFRSVIRGADGSRAVSNEVTVSVTRGSVATFFSHVEAVYADGAARIRWSTESTPDLSGFNVYRRDDRIREFRKLNERLISTEDPHEYNDSGVTPGASYSYQVAAVHKDEEWVSQAVSLTIPATGFELEQNHPNPFNPLTTISFSIGRPGRVRLSIFSVNGALVRTLVDGDRASHRYSVAWDGTNDSGQQVTGGVYFYKLVAGSSTDTKKMVLLK